MNKWDRTRMLPFFCFALLACITLVSLFHPYARDYFFLFDDLSQLSAVSSVSFGEIWQQPIAGTYRPLGYFFWKVNLLLFGWQNPVAFAFANLLTHCISAMLLGLLIKVFRFSSLMAWSTATIYLCFPAMSEALFWMTGGHDVYGMPFLLVSLIFAGLMLRTSDKKSYAVLLAGIILTNLLALLSKETAYVAFPIAFSLWSFSRRSINRDRLILGSWLVAFALSFLLFLYLRLHFIPISQSHYGNPVDMFLKHETLRNLVTNFKALFALGYFGENTLISRVLPLGTGLLVVFFGFSFLYHPKLTFLLSGSLICSLVITAFIGIGPGSVVSGRLLYTSCLILSIILASGISSLMEWRNYRWNKRLGFACLSILIVMQHISTRSFSERFTEATKIARNVMWQTLPFTEHAHVHIKNLPRFLYDGPHIMKCYSLQIYFQNALGKSTKFRCSQVNLISYSHGYREIDARVHDPFSDYAEPMDNEEIVELSFISDRNCPEKNPQECLKSLNDNKHPVFTIIHGCPAIDDFLFSINLNEIQMLLFSGNWFKECSGTGYKIRNLVLYSENSDSRERTPLYRCGASTFHFVSKDRRCGGHTIEGILGYASTQPEHQATTRMVGCFEKGGWRPYFDQPCLEGSHQEFLGYIELARAQDIMSVN